MEISIKIRLAIQKALIKNLSANVRGICCDWSNEHEWFKIVFYLTKEPDQDEIELQSIIMTEFECDIQDFKKIFEQCIYDPREYHEVDKLRLVLLWRDE